MKALLITTVSLLFTSIFFRLFHFPGGGLLTVSMVLPFFAFAVLNSVVKQNVWNVNIIGGWVLFLWILFFVFKTMFWPGASFFFIPAITLTLFYVVDILRSKNKKWSPLVLIFSAVGIFLFFLPSHRIYYVINLNDVFNKEVKEEQYDKWNTYSWLLYSGGKKQEAKSANAKAIEILEKTYTDGYIVDFTGYKYKLSKEMYESEMEILSGNREAILSDTWTVFNY